MLRYAKRYERRSRTYVLEVDIIEHLSELADQNGVHVSSVVNLLLRRALGEVNEGRWRIEAKAVAFDATWSE